MKFHVKSMFTAAGWFVLASLPAHADQVFTEDVIVDSTLLCVGSACANGEPNIPSRQGIKLNDGRLAILFEDTSVSTFPSNDWQISINETLNNGQNVFQITDVTHGTNPFKVQAAAPSNALVVAPTGNLGLGTSIPRSSIHIVDSNLAGILMEQPPFSNVPGQVWGVNNNARNFAVFDGSEGTLPFLIRPGAPTYAMLLDEAGRVGLGTSTPEGKLHTRGTGVQLAYFESSNGQPVQIRMRSNSQNRRFLAVNNANQVQSQLIFLNNQVRIAGPTDSGANLYAIIGPAGIATQGPVCDPGPCDKVFDPSEFTVPSIEEHAAFMWENQHLWAVGPTSPDEPFNLTQKAGGMLHELEVAHIYIEQLHTRLAEQEAKAKEQAAINARLTARLDALDVERTTDQ